MKLSPEVETVLLMFIAASMNKSGKILLQTLAKNITKKGVEGGDFF